MAIYAQTIGTLIFNITLFGSGIVFAILAMLIGITRGMSKEKSMWALTFSALAWTCALIIPSLPFSLTIFMAGAIGITMAYTPILDDVRGSHILIIAIIAGIMNMSMLIGFGAYGSVLTSSTYDSLLNTFETQTETHSDSLSTSAPDHGLCSPDEVSAGTCTDEAYGGSFNPLNFDPIASILKIGDYIRKIITFAGMTVLAPYIMTKYLLAQQINFFTLRLIGVYISLWNFAILFKVAMFIVNRRGQS